MIVIDVGCGRYGGDYSIERLIEEYQPTRLYGFDPSMEGARAAAFWLPAGAAPAREYGFIVRGDGDRRDTLVTISVTAAWTHDGEVRFMEDGLNGQVGDAEHWPLVPCFDLAHFIDELPNEELVLKLDAEGAEYELLEHLIERSADARLALVLVEWHGGDAVRRRMIEEALTCPVEEWRW